MPPRAQEMAFFDKGYRSYYSTFHNLYECRSIHFALVMVLYLMGGTTHNFADGYLWRTGKLSYARDGIAATTIGNLTMFGGGIGAQGTTSVVDVYDASTGTWMITHLSKSRTYAAATTVGDLAMFAGGFNYDNTSLCSCCYDIVDIYNITSMSWTVAHLSYPRHSMAATTVGDYAIFAGGLGCTSMDQTYDVDIYDLKTGAWATTRLIVSEYGVFEGASTNTLAIFGGGSQNGAAIAQINEYNITSGAWSVVTTSMARSNSAASSIKSFNLAIISGGINSLSSTNSSYKATALVDIYNGKTNMWSVSQLSAARYQLAGTSVGPLALFGGGTDFSNNPDYTQLFNETLFGRVDIYNAALGMWSIDELSQNRTLSVAVSNENRKLAFFAGGIINYGISYTPYYVQTVESKRSDSYGQPTKKRQSTPTTTPSPYFIPPIFSDVVDIFQYSTPTPSPSPSPSASPLPSQIPMESYVPPASPTPLPCDSDKYGPGFLGLMIMTSIVGGTLIMLLIYIILVTIDCFRQGFKVSFEQHKIMKKRTRDAIHHHTVTGSSSQMKKAK